MKLFANSNIEIYTNTKIHKLRQRGTNWSSILEAKELTFGIEDEFQSMLEGKVFWTSGIENQFLHLLEGNSGMN